ncbi:MAG: 30S ribosomal protein S2 [Candidatus Bilamarchaeaceae archaeon]
MEKTGLPVSQDMFLEAGVHIGTRIKTNDMKKFIFKKRDDGLYILDLTKTAERIMAAAKLLTKYSPSDILIVASRVYSSNAASKFSKLTGIPVLQGRFVPGTTTNLSSKQFQEPKLILVCDPKGEREAIMESAKNGVPIIALCDTDNETKFVDLIIPINNKGRRSLALLFYILAREVMLSQGKIKSYNEFKYDINFFEKLEEYDTKIEKKEKEQTIKEEEITQKEEEQKPEQKPEETKKESAAKEEKTAVEKKIKKKVRKPKKN